MIQRKILLVDSHGDALHFLNKLLTSENMQVEWATNAPTALVKLEKGHFDLVLLDAILPQTSGNELCQMIRLFSNIPIIFYTSLNHESEMIQGLQSGADDYIVKPVNKQLLLARIHAVLRRYQVSQAEGAARHSLVQTKLSVYTDGYLSLDLKARKVLVTNHPIHLTSIEYKLLAYLFQNAGQILTYDQILEAVWSKNEEANTSYIHTYISRLRRKLEKDPNAPVYLLTAYGTGYWFEKQASNPFVPNLHKFPHHS